MHQTALGTRAALWYQVTGVNLILRFSKASICREQCASTPDYDFLRHWNSIKLHDCFHCIFPFFRFSDGFKQCFNQSFMLSKQIFSYRSNNCSRIQVHKIHQDILKSSWKNEKIIFTAQRSWNLYVFFLLRYTF